MVQYRIKIEELNNGEKSYIPQYGTEKLIVGRFCWLGMNWENIISDEYMFQTSTIIKQSFNTEQEAIEIIEQYKQYVAKNESEKVKSVTYKKIN